MKKPTAFARASHLNTGTGIPEEELPWPETSGRVTRLPRLHLEVDERSTVTPYGGVSLAAAFLKRFRVAQEIDARVQVLKLHLRFHESDHVLAQALNLYVGGECLEDQASLQHDAGVLRILGACRLPDPTTAGDFLRRFEERRHPGALSGLRSAIDAVQDAVWGKQAGKRRRKRDLAVVDLDGHTKPLYGVQKEGADFDYKGRWSYNVLLASLAGTGECLAVRNRPGNVRSSEGAADLLEETLPRVQQRFRDVLVRADSDFDRRDVREACEAAGVHFAFVAREASNRLSWAEAIPESAWKPFRTRAHREREKHRHRGGFQRRRKQRNRRRRRARERGYTELALQKQWVAEIPWRPAGATKTYRMVLRRQLIEQSDQETLFEIYRYRYVVTDLPASWSAEEVIDTTYQRCDQENVIEQMGSGVAVWRMPVAEFDGNSAWLEIGRLAWNLGKWIAQLALPAEVVRWEWKRYRKAFVYVATEVVHRSRQCGLRMSPAHRFLDTLIAAQVQLQT
ncbi:MAG: IS1380 family transposase [Myxococcota bacterium]